jgi:hypothetical protein
MSGNCKKSLQSRQMAKTQIILHWLNASSISFTEQFAIFFLSPLVFVGVFLDDLSNGQIYIEDVLGVLGVNIDVSIGVDVHISEHLPNTGG